MRMHIRKISKSNDKQGGYPYIRMRVRLRMIFKYTEIECRKTHTRIWSPSFNAIHSIEMYSTAETGVINIKPQRAVIM